MSNPSSTVKRTPLDVHKASAGVTALQAVIAAGMASPDVQASPVAKQALADVQTTVGALSATLTSKAGSETSLTAARSALTTQFAAVEVATRTYESTINSIAAGDAAIITKAGLLARGQKTPPAALGEVKDARSTLGKAVRESVVRWPEVPGATSYALQVNWTPTVATATYTALPSGSSRRRVILAPAAGAQFLVQIAAIASDGTQSAWCDPYLATAR
jgi:hypothetical protein